MADKYDEAIAYLVAHPDHVHLLWRNPLTKHGCLFQVCDYAESSRCGCLTQVRLGDWHARTDELTSSIRNDGRLPSKWQDIIPTVEGLTPFAEWQRKMDAMWPERTAADA